jgi:hypothetical protein
MNSKNGELVEENESFLHSSRQSEDGTIRYMENKSPRHRMIGYMRIFFELAMAAAIVFLVFSRPSSAVNKIRRTPVPDRQLPHFRFSELEIHLKADIDLLPSSAKDLHISHRSKIYP